MSSSQRPQAATKSRLARLRHACGATQDSRRRDEYVSDDLGRIRHAWSATRVQTARCCLCADDQLSTKSVWLFPCRISAGWLCPLPRVRHPFGATRSCLVRLQEKEWGHGVSASWPSPSTVPAKDSDAPLAPVSHCTSNPFFLCGTKVYGSGRAPYLLFHDANPVSFPLRVGHICQVHLH